MFLFFVVGLQNLIEPSQRQLVHAAVQGKMKEIYGLKRFVECGCRFCRNVAAYRADFRQFRLADRVFFNQTHLVGQFRKTTGIIDHSLTTDLYRCVKIAPVVKDIAFFGYDCSDLFEVWETGGSPIIVACF